MFIYNLPEENDFGGMDLLISGRRPGNVESSTVRLGKTNRGVEARGLGHPVASPARSGTILFTATVGDSYGFHDTSELVTCQWQ
jgi:hypothetical protein